jgi:transcriptional regulator GlxA family with amidase domain
MKGPSRTVRDPRPLMQSFDLLLDQIHEHAFPNSILLSFRGMSLLADAFERKREESPLPGDGSGLKLDKIDDPLIVRAIELIWTYSHRILSVEQLAKQLSVTRRTLDRRFRAALGRTVLEEINNCRLSRAKRLLKETDLPVKTIVHLAGFSSTERMRIAFLQRESISPTEYRRSIKK